MHAERVLRPTFAAGLVLAVLTLLGVHTQQTIEGAGRRVGFVGETGPLGCSVLAVTPGLPAERAGMRVGDQVLSLNGKSARTFAEYTSIAGGFEPGRPVAMTLLREGRQVALTVKPGVPPQWSVLILAALAALAYLAVALIALAHWRRDPRIPLLAALTSAMAIELAMPLDVLGHPVAAPIFFSLFYLLTGFEIACELHLVSLIPRKHPWAERHRWLIPLFYGVGLSVGVLCCASYLSEVVGGRRILPWGADWNGQLIAQIVLPIWGITMTLLLVQQLFWADDKQGRSQAGLVLAGTFPWTAFVLGGAALRWLGQTLPPWTNSLEALVLLASPLAFLVAIARYRLFNIAGMAHRSLVYTALTGALLLAFYSALGIGTALFSHFLDRDESIWAVSFATLVLGLLFSPLRQIFQGWIERRFFPERQEVRRRLMTLASELSALGKLPKMARYLVGQLTEIFGARSAAILLASPDTGLLSRIGSTAREPETTAFVLPGDPAVEQLRRSARTLPANLVLRRSGPLGICLEGVGEDGLLAPLLIQDRLVGILGLGAHVDGRPFSSEENDLLSLVAHHLAIVFENARLFDSATYEGLTGLLRREAVLDQLDRELDRAARYGRPLTVAMADLDHFKEINDRYGHLSGDRLLKRVAKVLGGAVRSTDWLGRYGGEEFLLLLPETDLKGALAVAEKIRSRIEETSVPMDDGSAAQVTISIGIATLGEAERQSQAKVTARDLIAAADHSLYAAKRAGRNRIHPLIRVA